jgi:hypothetical protein
MHSPASGPSDCGQTVRGALGKYNLDAAECAVDLPSVCLSILPSGDLESEISAHAKTINQSTIPG